MAAKGSASGIRAGKAYVELSVKDNISKGLEAAKKRMEAFGKATQAMGLKMMTAGTALLAPLGAALKLYSDMGSALSDAADRTGVSVEALSQLGYAAGQSGADLATLETGLKRMQKALYEASTGSKSANDSLAAMGLTVADLRGLSPEKQFELIADRMSAIDSPATRAALAMELFGKQGVALLPMMKGGAAGIRAMRDEADRLGITMSTKDARAAEEFGDAMSRTWAVVKSAAFTIGAALAPAIQGIAAWLVKAVAAVRGFIDRNRGLVTIIATVGASLVGAGAALWAFGGIVRVAAIPLGLLAKLLPVVVGGAKLLASVFMAMMSPIGLVVAGVAALGVAFLKFTSVGQRALAWLGDKFRVLWDGVTETLGGIGDALAAGDIALAGKILWLSLKLAWEKGTAAVKEIWSSFTGWFMKAGNAAWSGLLAGAEYLWHGLKVAWIKGGEFLKKTWANVMSYHASATEGVADWITRKWIDVKEATGAMSPDDAAFARDYAAKQNNLANRKIEDERKAKIAAAEAASKAEMDKENQTHDAALAVIGSEYDARVKAIRDAHAENIKAAEGELATARAEWQAAIAAAKAKRAAGGGGGKDKDRTDYEGIADQLAGVGAAMRSGPSMIGTFNPFEIAGLAGQTLPIQQRIATATEKTARGVGNLVRTMQHNTLRFI